MELTVSTAASQQTSVQVSIDYINYRGERSKRIVVPQALRYLEVEWHPGPQWILEAWDVEKRAVRSFAMCDIQEWAPCPRREVLS